MENTLSEHCKWMTLGTFWQGIRVSDGLWHHVCVTWVSKNGTLQAYKDGVLQDSKVGCKQVRWVHWAVCGLLDKTKILIMKVSTSRMRLMDLSVMSMCGTEFWIWKKFLPLQSLAAREWQTILRHTAISFSMEMLLNLSRLANCKLYWIVLQGLVVYKTTPDV